MPDAPLIVPIALDALVVNAGILGRDAFRWWPYAYASLANFKSPEPEALSGGITQQDPGIYLHWTLPEGLRHGKRDRLTGETVYPLVPNRWLVVRFSGSQQRQAAAWVLESDCPVTDQTPAASQARTQYLMDPAVARQWQASPDPQRRAAGLDPAGAGPQVANIGVAFPAAQWSERDPHAMFLTAMAPGNHLFTAYVQHNFNIFSFFDPLEGISADQALSYQVIGWYSSPQADILAGWQASENPGEAWTGLLDQLGWSAPDDVRATTSLYQGMVFSIPWTAAGDPPVPDRLQAIRNTPSLDVAIGNNIADAFTALLNQQLNDPQSNPKAYPPGRLTLLKAFQYDLLPVLNQVNGPALLDWKVRQSWFGSKPGGYRWTLVPKQTDGTPAALTPAEAAEIARLNNASDALDQGLQALWGLQWRLNATWWKLGRIRKLPPPVRSSLPVSDTALAQQLDLSNAPGVAAQTLAQLNKVRLLTAGVPQPLWTGAKNAQEAFQNGIAAFAAANPFPASHQLKAVPKPRFWRPNDPVVVISGLEAPPVAPATLLARGTEAPVTGFAVDSAMVTASGCASAIPAVTGGTGLPAQVPQLVAEHILLDPASAASLAAVARLDAAKVAAAIASRAGYQGTLPAQPLGPWQQPWQPLFLEWRASYSYIPYETASWQFDGTDYHFLPVGLPATLETRPIGGICVLGPSPQFVFQARLKAFVDKYSAETDLADLYAWIDAVDQWRFLGQELTGFNDLLAMRDPRAYRRPGPDEMVPTGTSTPAYPIASLAGYNEAPAAGAADQFTLPRAQSGQVHSVPYLGEGTSPAFHGVRQGQFHLTDLRIYDKFGRVLELIGSGEHQGLFQDVNFPLVRDQALMPDASVQPGVAAVVQLPPRLLQHSRLDFELIDQADDSAVLGLAAAANPICGWVLPNHLDASLSIYGPDGAAMGAFRMVVNDGGSRVGEWQPPAKGTVTSLADVAAISPHLARLLQSPGLATEAGFNAFLAAIDETLWTVDPLGSRGDQNLSVLVGRPLALVRARLGLSVDGPAWTASDWSASVSPPAPDFLAYRFLIRLGDQAARQDGMIGYFLDGDYAVFNSVAAPEDQGPGGQSLVKQIGPLGRPEAGGGTNYIPVGFAEGASRIVTMLVDPRASVHAISGILPVKQVDIPSQFVDPVLARIEVGFHIGPLLTPLQPSPTQGGMPPAFPFSISYPAPAEKSGTWSWWEPAADGSWTGYGLLPATPAATLGAAANGLREGMLQLSIAMTDKSS